MGARGRGVSKARTSEQASSAAKTRWDRVRAEKKRGKQKGQNDKAEAPSLSEVDPPAAGSQTV